LTTSIPEIENVELLENRSSVGSLSETDNFSSDELCRFLLNIYNVQESSITGSERFP
ncbi:16517_t:CDS:1, partial [Dentiscutata erythropus]